MRFGWPFKLFGSEALRGPSRRIPRSQRPYRTGYSPASGDPSTTASLCSTSARDDSPNVSARAMLWCGRPAGTSSMAVESCRRDAYATKRNGAPPLGMTRGRSVIRRPNAASRPSSAPRFERVSLSQIENGAGESIPGAFQRLMVWGAVPQQCLGHQTLV